MCLAVPGRIVTLSDNGPLTRCGRVDFGGVVREVSLACVPEARAGDYVIVHAGLAISTLDPEEAQCVFRYLRGIGEAAEDGPARNPEGAR